MLLRNKVFPPQGEDIGKSGLSLEVESIAMFQIAQ